jgi:hypothetical protein
MMDYPRHVRFIPVVFITATLIITEAPALTAAISHPVDLADPVQAVQ